MRRGGRPAAGICGNHQDGDVGRGDELQGGQVAAIRVLIMPERFLSDREVFQIAHHGRDEVPVFVVPELWNGDPGENAHDHHHDKELDEGEAVTEAEAHARG